MVICYRLLAPGFWLAKRLSDTVFELLYSSKMHPMTTSSVVEQTSPPPESTQERPASVKGSEDNLVRLNGAAFAQVVRDLVVLWRHSDSPSSDGSASDNGSWDFREFVLDHGILSQCRGCSRRWEFYEL